MTPLLSVAHLTKQFTDFGKIKVLDNVSLTLHEGETLAIVGQSGSGKSTLLSLLAGLDQPSSGSITLAHKTFQRLSPTELTRFRAEKIGIIFQQFHLFDHLTALENVGLPLEIQADTRGSGELPSGIRERASKALSQVGLEHRLNHRPPQLSGGERQRVAMARAMILTPALILADEPTGNLDARTAQSVASLLFKLAKEHQTGLILVTHHEGLAARCDRQLRLSAGQLTEEISS